MPDSTSSRSRPPKTMSSRLMTMKFMQRAAAASPPTPLSQAHATELPPSKRQKISNVSSPADTSALGLQLTQTTVNEEEQRRIGAIERLAEDAGETKWVLSTVDGDPSKDKPDLHVTRAGYSEIDEGTWKPATLGRRSFGDVKQSLEKRGAAHEWSNSSEESSEAGDKGDEDGDHSDDPRRVKASKEEAIKSINAERLERKLQRKTEKAELARLAERRRKKEVKLSRLSSISGVSGSGGKSAGGKAGKECYLCGEKGHERRDCPQQGKRRRNESRSDEDIERSKPPKTSLRY